MQCSLSVSVCVCVCLCVCVGQLTILWTDFDKHSLLVAYETGRTD